MTTDARPVSMPTARRRDLSITSKNFDMVGPRYRAGASLVATFTSPRRNMS